MLGEFFTLLNNKAFDIGAFEIGVAGIIGFQPNQFRGIADGVIIRLPPIFEFYGKALTIENAVTQKGLVARPR